MSGYFRTEADDWQEVAEVLVELAAGGRAWLPGQVRTDLRWWADRVRCGVCRRIPNSKALAARWAWSEWKVRQTLGDEEWWADPYHEDPITNSAKFPRKLRGVFAKPETGDPPLSDDFREVSAKPPRKIRDTRVVDPPITDHRSEENATPPASLVLRLVEPEAEATPDPLPEWATKAAKGGIKASEIAATVVRAIETIRQRPIAIDRCSTDANEVLALWRALGRPPLSEFAADVELVAAACRESADPLFAHDVRGVGWRGERPRDRSLFVGTLCVHKRWGDRLEAARRWQEAGRPQDEARPLETHKASAEKAWEWLQPRLRAGTSTRPDIRGSNGATEAKALALEAGIEAAGGWLGLRRADPRFDRENREAFVAAYCKAMGGADATGPPAEAAAK